jgi:hypothetical protein
MASPSSDQQITGRLVSDNPRLTRASAFAALEEALQISEALFNSANNSLGRRWDEEEQQASAAPLAQPARGSQTMHREQMFEQIDEAPSVPTENCSNESPARPAQRLPFRLRQLPYETGQ